MQTAGATKFRGGTGAWAVMPGFPLRRECNFASNFNLIWAVQIAARK